MNRFWKFGSVVSFNKARESHIHHAFPVNDKDRKIDDMPFWPFLPEFTYISSNSRRWNGKHAYGGTEPRREEICEIVVYKWKASPVEECDK